jgi:hypothetical protein
MRWGRKCGWTEEKTHTAFLEKSAGFFFVRFFSPHFGQSKPTVRKRAGITVDEGTSVDGLPEHHPHDAFIFHELTRSGKIEDEDDRPRRAIVREINGPLRRTRIVRRNDKEWSTRQYLKQGYQAKSPT